MSTKKGRQAQGSEAKGGDEDADWHRQVNEQQIKESNPALYAAQKAIAAALQKSQSKPNKRSKKK